MNSLKSNIAVGIGAALAVTVLAPVLMPALAAMSRPVAKGLLKGGLVLYDRGREAVAVAGESIEDMVAELRAEGVLRADGEAGAEAWSNALAPGVGAPIRAGERIDPGQGGAAI